MDDIFDTLTILNDIQLVENVENVCNICGAGHYAQECPDFIKGYHVEDTPLKNLSRSSVPNGLLILDRSEGGTCVITSQKFAKGTRFGPLYAEKSYIPLINLSKFPLIIYPDSQIVFDDLQTTTTASLQEIFSIRNIYLDISNEQKCNWMIHVNHAEYSNEQNLICYQENRQIYYTAIQDLELGDILKVWYSPCYAQKLGIQPQDLPPSNFAICNNILQQVSIDYGINLNDDIEKMNDPNYYLQYTSTVAASATTTSTASDPTNAWYSHNSNSNSNSQEISLPPINSLIKTSSPNYSSNFYDLDTAFSVTTVKAETTTPVTEAITGALYDLNAGLNGLNGGSFDSALGGSSVLDTSNSNMSEIFLNDNDTVTYAALAPPATENAPMSVTQGMDSNNNNSGTHKEDASKVKFTCEQCNKKYMTKSNLEKHMRIHDLFMCVVCMKIHNSTDELKEHACFKKKAKNSFHCDVCLKVLSNSWSLQRHMKIHRPADIIAATMTSAQSTVITVEDISNPQSYEQSSMSSPPPPHMQQLHYEHQQYDDTVIKDEIFDSESDMQEANSMIDQSEMHNMDGIAIQPIPCDDDFDDLIKIHSNNNRQQLQYQTSDLLPEPQHQQLTVLVEKKKKVKDESQRNVVHTCVVCARVFKNPNALEKHLRTVHTVNVLSTTASASAGANNVLKLDAMPAASSSYKNYKDSRKTVLHTSTPIKPSIAKALANKLTEKNNKKMMESVMVEQSANCSPGSDPNQYQQQFDSYQIETLNVSPASQQQLQQYTNDYHNSDGQSPSGSGNNNNTIIIISNVELNNSLIDTSQLFLNQNSVDLKMYNTSSATSGTSGIMTDNLPKLVPISSSKCNNLYMPAAGSGAVATITSNAAIKSEDASPESPQLFVIPKDKPLPYNNCGSGSEATLIKHSHSSSILTTATNNMVNVSNNAPVPATSQHIQKSSQNKVEPQPDQTYTCDECDKKFKKKYQLTRHQETHGSIYYYCPFCERSPVKAKSSLKKHFVRDHQDKINEWNHPSYINELVVRDVELLQQLQLKAKPKVSGKRTTAIEDGAATSSEQSTKKLGATTNLPDRYFFNQNSSNSCSTLDSNSKNDTMLSFDDMMFTNDYQQQQQQHIIINATSTNLPAEVTPEVIPKGSNKSTKKSKATSKPPKISKKKVKENMKRKYENISDDSTTNCDLSATSNNLNNNNNNLNLMNNNKKNLYDEQQQQQSYEFTNLPNKKPKLPNGAIYTSLTNAIITPTTSTALTSNFNNSNSNNSNSNNNHRIVTIATPPASASSSSALTYNINNGGNTFLATNLVFHTTDNMTAKQVTATGNPNSTKTTPDAIIIENLFDNISMDDNNLLKYTLTSDDFTDDPTNNIIIDAGRFQNSFNQIQEKLDADDLSDFRSEQLKWTHDDDNANDLMDDDRTQLSSTSSNDNDNTNKLLEMEENAMLL